MNFSTSWLSRLPAGSLSRQIAIAVGLSLLIFALLLGGYLLLRPQYRVLLRGLKPQDAAAVATELDKEQIPYRYDEADRAILVPEGEDRAARVRLASADLRLRDVVGLELFKDADLGLTEFAQKVNYQRALQGEIARTLMSLQEVDMARVHLTLPESSIFRRDQSRAKASITVFPKDGLSLGAESVRGIQRLVAASVPGMTAADVVVLDQTGAAASSTDDDVADPKLALRQAIESRYEKKIAAQLARILGGEGRAAVSVSVDINFDQVQTTRESGSSSLPEGPSAAPLPASAAASVAALAADDPLPPLPAVGRAIGGGGKTQRVVEQVIGAPGSIRRITVGIVLDRVQPAAVLDDIHTLVTATAGLDSKRGDLVSTVVRDPVATGAASPDAAAADTGIESLPDRVAPASPAATVEPRELSPAVVWAAIAGFAVVLLLWIIFKRRAQGQAQRRPLSDEERRQFVARLRHLLETEAGHGHPSA